MSGVIFINIGLLVVHFHRSEFIPNRSSQKALIIEPPYTKSETLFLSRCDKSVKKLFDNCTYKSQVFIVGINYRGSYGAIMSFDLSTDFSR